MEPAQEPGPDKQPLWQPPPALVAILAWLRRRGRELASRVRSNPRRLGVFSASFVCGLLLRRIQQHRLAVGVVRTVALSTLLRRRTKLVLTSSLPLRSASFACVVDMRSKAIPGRDTSWQRGVSSHAPQLLLLPHAPTPCPPPPCPPLPPYPPL